MPRRPTQSVLVALLVLLTAGPATAVWQGPDGPLPFTSADEVVSFLVHAEVVARRELPAGTTKPWKLTLERDGVRAHAIFRTIEAQLGRDRRQVEDHYRHEVAAFEVARLLGLDTVPPAALREVDGRKGSVQLWVENARSETERIEAGGRHDDQGSVARVMQRMRVFDALIHNFDRNTGNLLFDTSGKMWWVDHTRAFKARGELPEKLNVDTCERRLWAALRDLDAKQLQKAMRPYLDPFQSAALLERLETLRGHLAGRIESLGEEAVLFDLLAGD